MGRRSFSVIVIFIALAILGVALVGRLPVKLMPSRTLPSLTVTFSMPDAAARTVESDVTAKLEGLFVRMRGVKEINSSSGNGYGVITVGFDKHTDMEKARFEASSIVRQAWPQLPEGVGYPQVSASRTASEASSPILTYTVNAPEPPPVIMEYAEDELRTVLARVKGVERVSLSGATPLEWRLDYDSDLLQSLGLTPGDLVEAIAAENASHWLGTARVEEGEWIAVRVSGNAAGGLDLSKIAVTAKDSTVVPLDRLVTARHTEAKPTVRYRINGLNSIYCNIYGSEDANQLETAREVRRVVSELKLPEGYVLNLRNDVTERISAELEKIYMRTGLTLAILLVFVALVTWNLRYTFIVATALLLSLCVAVIFYLLAGIEIQLYSLAGITVSLNLIIDNILVMGDHYRRRGDLRVFTSILAATLTTIGALGIVFFLDDKMRLDLEDFVTVVIINLGVSLAAALWLVPALVEKVGLGKAGKRASRKRLRRISRFNRIYGRYIGFSRRWRWAFLTAAVLAFGLPVHLIPKESVSDTYNEKVRPWVNRLLGGTLRLFAEGSFNGGDFFSRTDVDPVLKISATLPNGSTIDQMNELVMKMEAFLTTRPDISYFTADIRSALRADISVHFTKKAGKTAAPYRLKSDVIRKALTLGGGSWSVYGLEDMGFNNAVSETAGHYQVKMTGYNYDDLEEYAEEFRKKLLERQRIKDVTVGSEFSWVKSDYSEFFLEIDRDAMARRGIGVGELYAALKPVFGRDMAAGTVAATGDRILLSSRQSGRYDVWALMNMPFTAGGKTFKLSDFASVQRVNAPRTVAKENQQYRLCLQYEYVGSDTQGRKLLKKDMEEFEVRLPMGFKMESPEIDYSWNMNKASNWWLILLVVAVIFFTTSIQFNSFKIPLVIIFTIPVSFIGVFLVFWLAGLNFTQGGFAAFVLLCGITVNAAIYLLDEYRRTGNYLRAFNIKIVPILLTVLSTALGFIPFMIGDDGRDYFWFPFALGTIGGLVMSLIAIVFLLPCLTSKTSNKFYVLRQ